MWVTSGLLCGSVGQMGQQVQPTFNLAFHYHLMDIEQQINNSCIAILLAKLDSRPRPFMHLPIVAFEQCTAQHIMLNIVMPITSAIMPKFIYNFIVFND